MQNQQWLPFLSNEFLCAEIRALQHAAERARSKADKDGARNVIDPFSALFQMGLLGISPNDWPKIEQGSQIEKSLQNQVGNFHQKILGKVGVWQDLGTGAVLDLVSTPHRIVAEIKNKHNTIKASHQASLYEQMLGQVRKKGQGYFGFTAYYVEIIPKKPTRYNVPFTPSDNTTGLRKPADDLIRRIDGASFYALVTGYPDALMRVFDAIPHALEELGIKGMASGTIQHLLTNYFHAAFGE